MDFILGDGDLRLFEPNREEAQMVIRKEVRGVVEFNDGEFAEIQTVGIEGTEKNLLQCKIQLHREDTDDSRQEFQHRFPVDTWLHISTTIQVRTQLKSSSETLDMGRSTPQAKG